MILAKAASLRLSFLLLNIVYIEIRYDTMWAPYRIAYIINFVGIVKLSLYELFKTEISQNWLELKPDHSIEEMRIWFSLSLHPMKPWMLNRDFQPIYAGISVLLILVFVFVYYRFLQRLRQSGRSPEYSLSGFPWRRPFGRVAGFIWMISHNGSSSGSNKDNAIPEGSNHECAYFWQPRKVLPFANFSWLV